MRIVAVAACVLLCTADLAFGAALPGWVRELAASTAGSEAASAIVLLDQVDVTVATDGKIRTSRRYAVRLYDRGARDAARLREVYVAGTGKVTRIHGWLVRAGGSVRELGNRNTIDIALVDNDLYNEVRVRAIGAVDEVARGDIFAAEVDSEDRLLFAQLEWQMQGRWPTRVARRTLTLGPGWRANSVVFNAPPLQPRREGAALIWEMTDVPALPSEDGMPPPTDLAPRVAVSFFGPDSRRATGQFERWDEVSAWLHALSDASARATETVAAKARELAASAGTEFERAAAIARYVQRVHYVSIQTGIGRGGGYQPRPASLVLERNYGDCKDKAALMRAMLASVGIKSHVVSIFSGDRNYVRPEWPSPQQFNHAIVAVALSTVPSRVTGALDHPDLGRLVLFDPTDAHTPFGELPLHEQGSLALIVAPSGGALVRMPLAPGTHHKVSRTIEGVIGADGMLSATVREQFTGALAAEARARHAALDGTAYRASIESRMAAVLPRVRVRNVKAQDDSPAMSEFMLATDIEATGYAQMPGRLLFLALPFELGGRRDIPMARERHTAVLLEPRLISETVRLKLPTGFAVDETPSPVALETRFGRYNVDYSIRDGYVVATRLLETPLQTIRPQQYSDARDFFDKVRAADSTPVVLIRISP